MLLKDQQVIASYVELVFDLDEADKRCKLKNFGLLIL